MGFVYDQVPQASMQIHTVMPGQGTSPSCISNCVVLRAAVLLARPPSSGLREGSKCSAAPTQMHTHVCAWCLLHPTIPGSGGHDFLLQGGVASVCSPSWFPTYLSACTQLVGLTVNQLFSVTAAC